MFNNRHNNHRALLDAAYEIGIEEALPSYGNNREQRADRVMFGGRHSQRTKQRNEEESNRHAH